MSVKISADELEEVYRVECACGMVSGNINDRRAGESIVESHSEHCDENCEVTTGYIPGYA